MKFSVPKSFVAIILNWCGKAAPRKTARWCPTRQCANAYFVQCL